MMKLTSWIDLQVHLLEGYPTIHRLALSDVALQDEADWVPLQFLCNFGRNFLGNFKTIDERLRNFLFRNLCDN